VVDVQPPLEHPIDYDYVHDELPDPPRYGWRVLYAVVIVGMLAAVIFAGLR